MTCCIVTHALLQWSGTEPAVFPRSPVLYSRKRRRYTKYNVLGRHVIRQLPLMLDLPPTTFKYIYTYAQYSTPVPVCL